MALAGWALPLARPWPNRVTDDPTGLWIALFVTLGLASALWPLPGAPTASRRASASPRSSD